MEALDEVEVVGGPVLKRCEIHRVTYNENTAPECPICHEAAIIGRQIVAEEPKRQSGKQYKYTCPNCRGLTMYEGSCSRYQCRKALGKMKKIFRVFRCPFCSSPTKYPECCSKYKCRKKAGRHLMYNAK